MGRSAGETGLQTALRSAGLALCQPRTMSSEEDSPATDSDHSLKLEASSLLRDGQMLNVYLT